MPQNLQLTRQPNGANIRASEGAGTTTLTNRDSRWQVFNLSAARTVVLPSDGSAGDVWQISNVGTGVLTLQSSGLNTIATFTGGSALVSSLVAAPTSAAHWTLGINGLPPTAMSDSQATALGLKQYVVGNPGGSASGARTAVFANGASLTYTATSSNGGVLETASNASYAILIPYQMQDGSWRLKAHGYSQLNIAGSGTIQFFFTGFTFKSYSSATAWGVVGGDWSTNYVLNGGPGTNNIVVSQTGVVAGSHAWNFDIDLTAKPTWAY